MNKGENMNDILCLGERLDDLQLNNLKIIQNPEWFCFGIDAVLLSDFAAGSIKKGSNVIDFCSGNGIIPLLLSAKTNAKKISGIEIQECVADLAKRNVIYNNLEDKISICTSDLKDALNFFNKSSVDYITCNPPYKENHRGLKNETDIVTIARHEIFCNLEDILTSAEKLLKPYGKIALIHRPERLIDIIYLMRQKRIEPKRIRFVHPSANKTATMILVEGVKHGGKNLHLEPPLYIYDENNNYTEEINRIYGRL